MMKLFCAHEWLTYFKRLENGKVWRLQQCWVCEKISRHNGPLDENGDIVAYVEFRLRELGLVKGGDK